MSHASSFKPSPFEELSEEEQLQFIETHLDEIVANLRGESSSPLVAI